MSYAREPEDFQTPCSEVGMTQTDNVTEPNHPEQPGNAWVRSTFYGLATRTVVVRCPLCHHDHPHHWQYESGDEDPGERPAPCGRGQYVVRLRRAVQERLPNKPPPHPAPAHSTVAGTTTSGAERTARDRTTSPATPTPPTSFADVLNALPPALADYIRDLAEVSGAPIDHVALVVLRAVGSLTADGLSEQAQAELDALLVKPEETGPANQ